MTKEKFESKKEYESIQLWEARPAYTEGKLKLHFEYTFNTGKTLVAQENDNGIATVVLKQDNRIIFNFADLLPKKTQFITPSFINNYIELAKKQGFSPGNPHWQNYDEDLSELLSSKGEWEASINNQYVAIGDWQNPQNILSLLHEIGHAYQELKPLYYGLEEAESPIAELAEDAEKPLDANVRKAQVNKLKQMMLKHSESERDAWAYALRKFREIQKKTNIDLKSIFTTSENVMSFVKSSLCAQRHHYEELGYAYGAQPKESGEEKIQKEVLKYFDKPVRN